MACSTESWARCSGYFYAAHILDNEYMEVS